MSDGRASDCGYIDAHLHLQDPALGRECLEAPEGAETPVAVCLSNGTHPDDWEAVHQLRDVGRTRVLKAYGVHPWRVDNLPDGWEERLRSRLKADGTSVGEIGLDHWIDVKDADWQREVFERQLVIASELDLPPTLHCLRAWGMLVDCLKDAPDLRRGFLVHGFGGSVEILRELADLGGYFSFSAYAADKKRKRMRDAIRACPADRLLAETDAPDMVPPEEACRHPLQDKDGKRLHHPLEIGTAYAFLAEMRDCREAKLTEDIRENFHRLFG